jgi:hypothetical protein
LLKDNNGRLVLSIKKGPFPFGKALFSTNFLVDQFVAGVARRIVRRAGCNGWVVLERRSQLSVQFSSGWIGFRAFDNSADGASGIAAGAFRAFFRIDNHEILIFIFARVNTIDWAHIHALSVNFA